MENTTPKPTEGEHGKLYETLGKLGTPLFSGLVAFGTVFGGMWLTNRDQDKQLDMMQASIQDLRSDIGQVDNKFDALGGKVDKLRDDTRQDFRELRAEINDVRNGRRVP